MLHQLKINNELIKLQLDGLDEYNRYMENHLNNDRDRLINKIKKLEDQFPEDDIYNQVEEEGYYLNNIFPNIIRESFLITQYSFLEKSLRNLCDLAYEKQNLDNNVRTFGKKKRERGVSRFIKYLQKEAGLKIDKGQQPWQAIDAYEEVRNILIHDNNNEIENKKIYNNINGFSTGIITQCYNPTGKKRYKIEKIEKEANKDFHKKIDEGLAEIFEKFKELLE